MVMWLDHAIFIVHCLKSLNKYRLWLHCGKICMMLGKVLCGLAALNTLVYSNTVDLQVDILMDLEVWFECCSCFVGDSVFFFSFFFLFVAKFLFFSSFFFFVGECVRVSLRLLHRISECVAVVSLVMVLLLFPCLVWGVASGCWIWVVC